MEYLFYCEVLTIPFICLSFAQYLGVVGGAEKTLDFCVNFCLYTWVYICIGVFIYWYWYILVLVYIGTGVFRVYFNLESLYVF